MKRIAGTLFFAVLLGSAVFSGGGPVTVEAADVDRRDMVALHWSADLARHLAQLDPIRGVFEAAPTGLSGPIVVNFFASWCPPCGPEAETMGRLAAVWQTRGVRFLSINLFEDFGGGKKPERLERFLARYAADFPVLRGTAQTAALFGGVDRIPTLFIFNPDGTMQLLFVHERGAAEMHADSDLLNAAIERAAAGR